MADWYEAYGRVNTNSFLYKAQWNTTTRTTLTTTTTSTVLKGTPYMGEVTGGSPYLCSSAGLPGVPHIPRMGNQYWGVGDTENRPVWFKEYADDCQICGARIQNRYNVETWRWDGWRPFVTAPPKYLIEEDPV